MSKPTDQTDILSQVEKLTADLAAANTLNAEAQASITALTSERDTLKSKDATNTQTIATLTSERDTLKTENATLTARVADFNKSVAAQTAKLGIADNNKNASVAAETPLTATEKVLKAKGVKTIDELAAKTK